MTAFVSQSDLEKNINDFYNSVFLPNGFKYSQDLFFNAFKETEKAFKQDHNRKWVLIKEKKKYTIIIEVGHEALSFLNNLNSVLDKEIRT